MASSTLPRHLLRLATLVMLLAVAASGENSAVPGQFRINCGASASANDADGRTWDGDAAVSKSGPPVGGVAAGASYEDPSLPSSVPYMTARVFASSHTYSFPVTSSRVFLRLFFYPSDYGDRSAADALFGVTAGGVTLLRDFNASQAALALNYAYIVREFSLNVSSGAGRLDVTFTPSQVPDTGSSSAQYYAFVNGIEIVAAPADMFRKPVPTLANGGRPDPMPIRADTAFQTMYRLNVGGLAVNPSNDSADLYRAWDEDSPYILGAAFGVYYDKDSNVSIRYGPDAPPYAAPEGVYASARSMGPTPQVNLNYNLTWVLSVDAGFFYVVRLHFCEIQYRITMVNQRVFDVYINNQTAQNGVDVIDLSGGIGRPVYADYLVVAAPGSVGQTDLWVELHPDVYAKPQYYDAILNGLEVFKLQTYDGDSLAGTNPPLPPSAQRDAGNNVRPKKTRGASAAAWAGAGGGLAAVLVGCLCAWAIYNKRKRKAAAEVVDVRETPDSPPSVILDQTKSPYVFETAR